MYRTVVVQTPADSSAVATALYIVATRCVELVIGTPRN